MSRAPNYSQSGSLELIRARGWTVGDRLRGVSEHGDRPVVIELVFIGEEMLVAKRVREDGKKVHGRESSWTLGCRDWRRVRKARTSLVRGDSHQMTKPVKGHVK